MSDSALVADVLERLRIAGDIKQSGSQSAATAAAAAATAVAVTPTDKASFRALLDIGRCYSRLLLSSPSPNDAYSRKSQLSPHSSSSSEPESPKRIAVAAPAAVTEAQAGVSYRNAIVNALAFGGRSAGSLTRGLWGCLRVFSPEGLLAALEFADEMACYRLQVREEERCGCGWLTYCAL